MSESGSAPAPTTVAANKWRFLEGTFLSNAKKDANIRRGRRVYAPTITDEQRELYEATLYGILRELAPMYATQVQEDTHVQNVGAIVTRLTDVCGAFMNEGRLTFGVAQKLLNSYLKYLWCSGKIVTPPHCPFDSLILGVLKLPSACEYRWTFGDAHDYQHWVTAAKTQAGTERIAEWELRIWEDLTY